MRKVDFNLYLITDRTLFPTQCGLYLALEDALKAGVKAIQLREKDLTVKDLVEIAYWMRELTDEYGTKLIINDRADVALSVGADGIHLGNNSIPAHAVRKISEDGFLIGMSTHNLEEALKAEKEGADFITLGPVFETPSKLQSGKPVGVDVIKKVKEKVTVPVFAVGGININRVNEVKEAGADGIALISAILSSKNIKETTEEFVRLLK